MAKVKGPGSEEQFKLIFWFSLSPDIFTIFTRLVLGDPWWYLVVFLKIILLNKIYISSAREQAISSQKAKF